MIETEKHKFDEKWWSLISHHFDLNGVIEPIYNNLIELNRKGHKILPNSSDIFKQFRECKYDDVLVCFLTPEPIISYKQSLYWQYMNILIEVDCYDGLFLDNKENMDYLLPQGVIHLSPSLTYSKDNNHIQVGWQPFIKDCIKHLSNSLNNIIFVYDDSCIELLDKGNFKRHKIIPLKSGCFIQINEFLKSNYNFKIKW